MSPASHHRGANKVKYQNPNSKHSSLRIGQMGAAAVCFKRAGYRVLLWARNAQNSRQRPKH